MRDFASEAFAQQGAPGLRPQTAEEAARRAEAMRFNRGFRARADAFMAPPERPPETAADLPSLLASRLLTGVSEQSRRKPFEKMEKAAEATVRETRKVSEAIKDLAEFIRNGGEPIVIGLGLRRG